jgi:hypothetical protein
METKNHEFFTMMGFDQFLHNIIIKGVKMKDRDIFINVRDLLFQLSKNIDGYKKLKEEYKDKEEAKIYSGCIISMKELIITLKGLINNY